MEKKKGRLDDNTLIRLGIKKPKNTESPFTKAGQLKSTFKKVNNARFKTLIDIDPPEAFKVTQKDMISRSVLQKLVRTGQRANKRELTLKGQPMQYEDRSSDDEEANKKRTGLPEIKNFYRKYREMDKRI